MAPPSKGTNPAPNYTVAMNRVQTQLEAQLRIVRSFMPSRPPSLPTSSTTTNTAKPTPSFSALASTSNPLSASKSTRIQTQHERQKQVEESLFAETRAQDPNAGLGFGGPKRRSEKEREREDQILRSRLLGRRKRERGTTDASGRSLRRDESSSDEEPGRSGLGRAKKRARREEVREEAPPPGIESDLEKIGVTPLGDGVPGDEGKLEAGEDGDGDVKNEPSAALPRDDVVPSGSVDASGQNTTKRKRKKKKKKAKSKEAEGE
ncbi:hypothetical protein GGR51DRAFT_60445 [Nemania sp. FL0031]|nr:hypothetical protein GGR51DRAFT_60445 [Nemania sp. FL0031]